MRFAVAQLKFCCHYLSDDELFNMDHILSDRRQEPIKTFLCVLLERDAERTALWLEQKKYLGEKAIAAVGDLIPLFAVHFPSNALFNLMGTVIRRIGDIWLRGGFLIRLAHQLKRLEGQPKNDVRLWQLIAEAATKDPTPDVRKVACYLLLIHCNCIELPQRLMWSRLERFIFDDTFHDLFYPTWYIRSLNLRDPKAPITSKYVAYVTDKLNLDVDEVRRQYETLATTLQIELNLEWRKPN